jgi:hypothetical protein
MKFQGFLERLYEVPGFSGTALSPNLAHGAILRVNAILKLMPLGLGPDSALEELHQILVGTAPSQRITEVQLVF